MKLGKILFSVLVFLAMLAPAGAQNLLRSCYKYNGYTRIRTERVYLNGGKTDIHPFWMSLEYVLFPDGKSDAWILELDFEEATSVNIPKGVSLSATIEGSKVVTGKQMESPSSDKNSFENASGKRVYWNVGKYLYETSEFNKLLSGVKSIDVATGWSPDNFFQKSFPDNEFSANLKKLSEVVRNTPKPTEELGDHLTRYADNKTSKTVVSNTISIDGTTVVEGIFMNYIYYKTTNKEDYDLTIMLKGDKKRLLNYDIPITLTFNDGSTVVMNQQQDTYNAVVLYPTADEVKMLSKGVRKISIAAKDETYIETFEGESFSKVIGTLYNSLQTLSVL